ncbi:MAG: DNA-directed RNA polymerase subunit L [Candidatus Anstonellales archaeon]
MEIKVIKEEENYLELEVGGEDISVLNAIREIALEDEDVEFASCTQEHPEVGNLKLIVRTKSKDPAKVLANAAKKLADQAKKFKQDIKKE